MRYLRIHLAEHHALSLSVTHKTAETNGHCNHSIVQGQQQNTFLYDTRFVLYLRTHAANFKACADKNATKHTVAKCRRTYTD